MPTTRQTFAKKVSARVGGAEKVLSGAGIGDYADGALPEFSSAASLAGRVRKVELTITGDGTDEYGLGSSWTDGFSRVLECWRWDSNDTNSEPILMGPEEYQIEDALPAAGSSQIRFLTYSPSSADRIVVTHTALHTLTDAATSISSWDEEAFADLVASRLLEDAATAVLRFKPQASDEDFLGGGTQAERASQYRESARRLMERYRAHFGLGTEAAPLPQAVAVFEVVEKLPAGVIDYRHTHSRRGRRA